VSSEARGKSCGLKMFLSQRNKACRPEIISRFLACCSPLVCFAEFFVNLVDGDDSPALGLNVAIFQLLGSRIF